VQIIVKASRQEDLYVEWSSTVDGPTFVGTRAETAAYLAATGPAGPTDPPENRLARADATGTSAKSASGGVATGAWEDTGFIVARDDVKVGDQFGWLPRGRLAAFAHAAARDDDQAAYALLDPLDR
jgi:hypothetical protein